MEGTSRAEFAEAVGAAIASARHFYREVDRLVIALKETLRDGPDPLMAVRGSTGKGSSAKQQGRVVLRDEYAILFEPEADDEEDVAVDGVEEDDDDAEDNEDAEAIRGSRKKKSAPAELDPDQSLLALRLSLSTSRPLLGFEPSLQYAVLGDWWVGGAKPTKTFLLKRGMLRRVPVTLAKVSDESKRIVTNAQVVGPRGDRKLSYRVLGGIHTLPLYDLDEAKAVDDLGITMKEHWRKVTEAAAD